MPRRREPEPANLLTIAEAAMLLGVSLPTMRRWDETGKFRAGRHPVSGYRIYLEEDVLRLRRRIQRAAQHPGA